MSIGRFKQKLSNLGFTSYKEYLVSEYWIEIKKKYMLSNLPKYCIGCKSITFQLHHRSYQRLGREQINDLLPLCGLCHTEIHKLSKETGIKIQATHKLLRILHGWSKSNTKKIFRPFSKSTKGFGWVIPKPKS